MSRDRKAQLGARVPKDVREMAVGDALRAGLSLNGYIERLIRIAHKDEGPAAPLPGQITVDDALAVAQTEWTMLPEETHTFTTEQMREHHATLAAAMSKRALPLTLFDPKCRNGTFHWTCGPGNPCPHCGGEA